MAQQTMRGIRLGAQSLESEVGVSYSARTKHSFQCPNGHVIELFFAQDAELLNLIDGALVKLDIEDLKTPRSHWEMLLERRSKEELDEILKERLLYIRTRRKAGKADV
jgi:imidazoleglycerol phosphate synthase glutamine amidotransferase subunit HisH